LTSEPMGIVGASRLLIPSLLFAVAPAVNALREVMGWLAARTGGRWRGALASSAVAIALLMLAHTQVAELAARCTQTSPLAIGLGSDREAVIGALQSHTTSDGRILWEDRPNLSATGHWTALLPVLTDRAYLGGLDASAGIEHDYVRFADNMLADRWLRDWSDVELEDFCRRYNIGWVVCWSPAALERFRAWKGATACVTLQDEGIGCLFAIQRPLSYVLKGEAHWLQADSRRIALGEVVPRDGQVVLSLHHLTGLRAAPDLVQVERELDPHDPIPFVRLRLSGPVTRVVLTWENR